MKKKEQVLASEEAAQKKQRAEIASKEREMQEKASLEKKQHRAAEAKVEPSMKDCGHSVYPPPKKLRRKVVGFVYEGLSNSRTQVRT